MSWLEHELTTVKLGLIIRRIVIGRLLFRQTEKLALFLFGFKWCSLLLILGKRSETCVREEI
jgi:hypothetical protein